MKPGGIVVCKSWVYHTLTFDREYTIVSVRKQGYIWITNDYGKIQKYKTEKFIQKGMHSYDAA